MSLKLFGTSIVVGVLGSVVEAKYLSKASNKSAAVMTDLGQGITPLILIATGFWSIVHGFQVGSARQKYMALAKADGEANAEARYDLPNLYVDGHTKHSTAFNCIQRSHQHIMETLPHLFLSSLIAWMTYPMASAVTTSIYSIGRYYLSTDYANCDGVPAKRYTSPLSVWTWYGLLSTTVLGALSAMKMSLQQKMW